MLRGILSDSGPKRLEWSDTGSWRKLSQVRLKCLALALANFKVKVHIRLDWNLFLWRGFRIS